MRCCSASKSSPDRAGHDDLAVDHAALGQRAPAAASTQLGEVAGERALVAAAEHDLVAVAEHDAAEAVPLRLVEPAVAGGSSSAALASIGRQGRHHGQVHAHQPARPGTGPARRSSETANSTPEVPDEPLDRPGAGGGVVVALLGRGRAGRRRAAAATPAAAQTPDHGAARRASARPARTITVDGVGVVSGIPDTATLSLGVSVQGPSAADAWQSANTKASASIDILDRRRRGQGRHPDRLRQRVAAVPRRQPGRDGYWASNSVERRHPRHRPRPAAVIDAATAAVGDGITPRRRLVLDRRHQRPRTPGPPAGGGRGQAPGRPAGRGRRRLGRRRRCR